MTVMGEFVYDGTTCMCTYASGYYTIYNTSAWNFISDSASWGNNCATYTATFGYRVLGATASTKTFNLTMHCDQDGNIS
jgi:hypothetical protein